MKNHVITSLALAAFFVTIAAALLNTFAPATAKADYSGYNGISLVAGTGTPQASPLASASTAITLIAPPHASWLHFYSSGGVQVQTDATATPTAFVAVTATWLAVGVRPNDITYFGCPTATALTFYYDLVK